MIVRFSASNIVAMILFIPLLIALGLILAFLVPLLAIIVAAGGILFLTLYVFAKIGLVKKQGIQLSSVSSGEHSAKPHKKGKSTVEVKDYRIR